MSEIKRKSFAPGALTAPIPPAIVSVGSYEDANILTIAWTGILATQPPKTYISVRPSRHSYGMLKEGGEFVINLPSVDMARTVDFVGIYTGAKMDKWQKCSLTKQRSEQVSPPTVAECPIALECRVTDVIKMGSHDVFMADIVAVSCREDIIDEEGKMRYDRANLLAYAHGEYYALGDIVGRFGFSTDKAKNSDKTNKKASKATEKQEKSEKTARKQNGYSKDKSSQKKQSRTPDRKSYHEEGKKPRSSKKSYEYDEEARPHTSKKRYDYDEDVKPRSSKKYYDFDEPKSDSKRPFYESAPKSSKPKKKPTDKNKGAPHGKRGGGKK